MSTEHLIDHMRIFQTFKWWHIALFGAFFALSAALMVPAQWAAAALERSTDGRVRVSAASGSPWSGRGDLAIRVDGDSEVMLRGTTWRLLPARLLTGDVAFELKFVGDTAIGSAVVARRATSLVVRDADVTVSAAAIAASVHRLRGVQPAGTIKFRTQGLTLQGEGFAGDAELTWQGAATSVAPLGDYRLVLHAQGGHAQIEVATLRGPLHLAASGDFGPAEGLRIRGTATAAAEYRRQLLPYLVLIGTERADGAVFFEFALPGKGNA
jgi:general secretion pathway protein N